MPDCTPSLTASSVALRAMDDRSQSQKPDPSASLGTGSERLRLRIHSIGAAKSGAHSDPKESNLFLYSPLGRSHVRAVDVSLFQKQASCRSLIMAVCALLGLRIRGRRGFALVFCLFFCFSLFVFGCHNVTVAVAISVVAISVLIPIGAFIFP